MADVAPNPGTQDAIEVTPALPDMLGHHSIDEAQDHVDRQVTSLRADAEDAAAARAALPTTPAEVLREAMRLRAAHGEPTR